MFDFEHSKRIKGDVYGTFYLISVLLCCYVVFYLNKRIIQSSNTIMTKAVFT